MDSAPPDSQSRRDSSRSRDVEPKFPGSPDAPPPGAIPAKPAGASAPRVRRAGESGGETNVKETVESILVAFILAFMFRAFIVEAFVIPTGSMAPTLLGAHLNYICEDCGYEFEVNYQSSEADEDDIAIPATARLRVPQRDRAGNPVFDKTYRVHCPSCGFRVPRFNPVNPANAATSPPVHYGDRILVLKYLYLLQEPQRWDVVVFKSPYQKDKHDYQQNYIKRLIATAGESVMILDGDVYVSTKGKASTPEDFVVQPKPRWAQEALWRLVHDADYQPRGAPRTVMSAANQPVAVDPPFVQPWQPVTGSGWDLSGKRVFRFDNKDGGGTLAFNPSANPETWALTDWLAYDITVHQNKPDSPADMHLGPGYDPDHNVSDVKLALHYHRTGDGDGPLRLTLTKLNDAFIAEITPAQAKLFMKRGLSEPVLLASAEMPSDCARPTAVEFSNADYRVVLRVAGRDLIVTTPEQYAPDVPFLINAFNAMETLPKPTVAISAERHQAELSHISLWRDVYYTNRDPGGGNRNRPARENRNPLPHANPYNFPERILHLGPDEYFTCGDNSLISLDGRYWTEPINLPAEDLRAQAGVVPGRFLLGKAFFVYWPAGFKPIQRETVPALIPNFGRMRFIH